MVRAIQPPVDQAAFDELVDGVEQPRLPRVAALRGRLTVLLVAVS